MLIFNYDLTGLLVSQDTADESPQEPGVYLVPAFATTTIPPELGQGLRARWNGDSWGIEEIPIPALPSYQEALTVLNTTYQKDVEAFNKAFSLAIMFDGATEEVKKTNIRARYAARKAEYSNDFAALRTQYGI